MYMYICISNTPLKGYQPTNITLGLTMLHPSAGAVPGGRLLRELFSDDGAARQGGHGGVMVEVGCVMNNSLHS